MLVMISQPMNGIPDQEVLTVRQELIRKFAAKDIEVVPSFDTTEIEEQSKNPGVYYLGRTLMNWMHKVDAVYFVPGWEKARGCVIERKICELYNIDILEGDI